MPPCPHDICPETEHLDPEGILPSNLELLAVGLGQLPSCQPMRRARLLSRAASHRGETNMSQKNCTNCDVTLHDIFLLLSV